LKSIDKNPFPFFRGKIFLYQPQSHKVSIDLVLFLSKIRGIKRKSLVVDLGAGFGFLSIVIAKKYRVKVIAVEIDEKMIKLLEENIHLNKLNDLIEIVKGDVKKIQNLFPKQFCDVIVTNPPFYPLNYTSKLNPYHFEVWGTLKDFLKASAYLLRDGGYLNILIPCFRLYEAFNLLDKNNLPARFLSFIYPTIEKRAKLSIITSIKNLKGPLECDKPLIINEKNGEYTEEVKNLLESFL